MLALDVLLQEQPIDDPDGLLAGVEAASVGRVGPDPRVVGRAAQVLAASSRPAIVTDRPLDLDGAELVVELAERTGAALVELGGGISFPVGHRHDCSDHRRG